jgi:hypothetical protein
MSEAISGSGNHLRRIPHVEEFILGLAEGKTRGLMWATDRVSEETIP